MWVKTPTYASWEGMKARCDNPNNPRYSDYGGRGISYDPRWRIFENFLEDMGCRPEGKTLDREDNDGQYCKDNCRWATRQEQQRNTRRSVLNLDIVLVAKGIKSLFPDLSTREVSRIVGKEFSVKSETVREALKGRVWT